MPPALDITGQKYNELTAIECVGTANNGQKIWKCVCSCGKEVNVTIGNLRSGHTKSCGHLNYLEGKILQKRRDILGKRFGRLTVVEYLSKSKCRCLCDCGNEIIRHCNHIGTTTFSCGCYQKERIAEGGKVRSEKYRTEKNSYEINDDVCICTMNSGDKFLFDECDYDIVTSHTWFITGGKYKYATSEQGTFHRMIFGFPDCFVDHVNGNTLDNRRCNLRECTREQNIWNNTKPTKNKTGYRGVYENERGKKYSAKISANDKTFTIGRFDNLEEAAHAYDRKAIELRGEFARTNFPRENYEKEVEKQ